MAQFYILLQYISKQHTGAENKILLRIFDQCAAKTCIFSYATRSESGGGGADGVYAHPKIWPKWRLCPKFSLERKIFPGKFSLGNLPAQGK